MSSPGCFKTHIVQSAVVNEHLKTQSFDSAKQNLLMGCKLNSLTTGYFLQSAGPSDKLLSFILTSCVQV